MPVYKYSAIDKAGKRIKGSLEAHSMETAKSSLRQTGCTIIEVYEPGTMNRDIDLPFLGNPQPKDMAVFCRQFVSILRAGVPVSTVLAMLGQQTRNRKLASAVHQMQADIEKGDSLAAAMGRHPRIFPAILVNMAAAGEESGNLEEVFRQMELYFDKAKRTRAAVSKAMTYPAVLVAVMIAVIFAMMTKIIPSFLESFEEMNIELPAITRGVMAVSGWFVKWWWLAALAIAALVAFCCFFRRTDKGRRVFGWLARKIPVVKSLSIRSACAAFSRTLSLLLASGLSLTDSLELAAGNMRNIRFEEAVRRIGSKVAEGWQLHAAIQESGVFPPMVHNLVGIGEESGDIAGMLEKAAEYYDEEVEQTTQRLLSLMEPFIILILAAFVVVVVLAIFLPMMNLTTAYNIYL